MKYLFLLFALAGCGTLEGLDYLEHPPYDYAADILITVDDETFRGVGATIIGEKKIRITSPVTIDYLYVHSCGRYVRYPQFGEKPLKGNIVDIDFVPMKCELGGSSLFFETYDLKGKMAWGMLAFRKGNEMPAQTYCNGKVKAFKGHSICQTKADIETAMDFLDSPTPVTFKGDPACNAKQISPKEFVLRPSKGWCFGTFSNGLKRHNLTALGIKRPLIRE
jgi:hypothetical protein